MDAAAAAVLSKLDGQMKKITKNCTEGFSLLGKCFRFTPNWLATGLLPVLASTGSLELQLPS